MRRKRWAEAARVLEALEERDRGRAEVLTLRVLAYSELQDSKRCQWTCERLLKIQPDDPDITLALAGSYLSNAHPALALRTFRHFLDRWPEHPRAGEARETGAALEAHLDEMLADLGLSGEDGRVVAIQHEQVQSLLEEGRFAEARRAAETLLHRRPGFVPALNNLSLVHAAEGSLSQAVDAARHVLDLQAENYHALSNLVHFLCLSGRLEEAREWAGRLKALRSEAADLWVKKAEALTYLGDDEGVLEAIEGARPGGGRNSPADDALLHHLAAVAAMRLGQVVRARRYWKQALKLAPGLELARANLDDLRRSAGERHAPWAFGLANWIPPTTVDAFLARVRRLSGQTGEEAVARAARRFLRDHPEVTTLVPVLLDRGDPMGRDLALRIALAAREPAMMAALRDFALGQRGPDEMRHAAAQAARGAGLFPPGPARLWLEGEWRETHLLDFEVHGEPLVQHRPPVQRWANQAREALHAGKPTEAEQALKMALDLQPDAPDLMNNLAVAYMLQGRAAESEQLLRRIHAMHPDYLFGRVSVAQLALRSGHIEDARTLLEPLLRRRQFHFSEFSAFCQAQMDLLLAQGNPAGASQWLAMWESVDPDNRHLDQWRNRLRPRGRLPRLPRP
jgi:Flp pilus assembly protein TadD